MNTSLRCAVLATAATSSRPARGRRQQRRWAAPVVVGLLLAVVLGVGGPTATVAPAEAAPAGARTVETRILVQNIAGGARHNGAWSALKEVEKFMTLDRPAIVLLQEICENQFEEFLVRYPRWSGHWAPSRDPHNRCPGANPGENRAVGDAVLTRWRLADPVTVHLHDLTPYGTVGNMPCGDVYLPDRAWPVHACSAHFAVKKYPAEHQKMMDASVAHLQPYLNARKAVVLGGDLNRGPRDVAIKPFRDRMIEADRPDNEPTHGGTALEPAAARVKIDHTFFKHFRSPTWTSDVFDRGRNSDHRLLRTTITGRRT